MKEAELRPPAIMEQKYLKAGIHLLISARGREKRGQLKVPLGGREGAGNLLVIRMIKVGIGAGQGWIWARWVVLRCMLATPALLLQHELHPRSTRAPVPRELMETHGLHPCLDYLFVVGPAALPVEKHISTFVRNCGWDSPVVLWLNGSFSLPPSLLVCRAFIPAWLGLCSSLCDLERGMAWLAQERDFPTSLTLLGPSGGDGLQEEWERIQALLELEKTLLQHQAQLWLVEPARGEV